MPTNDNINLANSLNRPIGTLNGYLKPYTLDVQGCIPQLVNYNQISLPSNGSSRQAWCPTNQKIYFTTASSVAAFDPLTNTMVATIPCGTNSSGILYCPSNNRIYVANVSSTNVSVINPTTNTVVATISISGGYPLDMCYCPSTDKIYLGSYTSGLYIIDPQTNSVVTSISITSAYEVTYCSDFDYIALGTYGAGGLVYIINPKTNTTITTISLSGDDGAGRRMEYCPSTKNLYVSNDNNFNMYIINLKNLAVRKSFNISNAYTTTYNPVRDLMYIGGSSGTCWTINPYTDEIQIISSTASAVRFVYCPMNQRMYGANNANNVNTYT